MASCAPLLLHWTRHGCDATAGPQHGYPELIPGKYFSAYALLENASTSYRAPRWPDPEIPRKIPKKYPPDPQFWTPRILTPKYPENTEKIPPNTKNAHFRYFFGILGVFSWGSRISARGVFFRYFPWKFRVGPSRGSVAGRGVLNTLPI